MFRMKNCLKLFVVGSFLAFALALHADETGVPSPLAPEAVSAASIHYLQQPGEVAEFKNTVTDCGRFFVVEVITKPLCPPHIPEKPGVKLPGKTLANYRVEVRGIGDAAVSEATVEEMLIALRLNHRKYLILMASMNPSLEIGTLARKYEEKYIAQLFRITADLEKALDADDQAGGERFSRALTAIEESVKSHSYSPVFGDLVDRLIRKLASDLETAKMEHKNPVLIIKIQENLDAAKKCKAEISDLSRDPEWKAFWNSAFIAPTCPFPVEDQVRSDNPSGCFTPEEVQARAIANHDIVEFLKNHREEYAPVPVEKILCQREGKFDYQVTVLMGRIFSIRDDGKIQIGKVNYLLKSTFEPPCGTRFLKIMEREMYGPDGKLIK